jgi:hypothetical protein
MILVDERYNFRHGEVHATLQQRGDPTNRTDTHVHVCV